jgi:hypothetical protein
MANAAPGRSAPIQLSDDQIMTGSRLSSFPDRGAIGGDRAQQGVRSYGKIFTWSELDDRRIFI